MVLSTVSLRAGRWSRELDSKAPIRVLIKAKPSSFHIVFGSCNLRARDCGSIFFFSKALGDFLGSLIYSHVVLITESMELARFSCYLVYFLHSGVRSRKREL